MKIATTLAAVAALSVATATTAQAQNVHGDGAGILSMLQREMERSSELLGQFWDSAFGGNEEQMDTTVVVVLAEAPSAQPSLTKDEKTLACRVAVQRVEQQALLKQEEQETAQHLRWAKSQFSIHFVDETSCAQLETPLMVNECTRVTAIATEIERFLRQGKSHEQICDAVQLLDEVMEESGDTPTTPLDPPPPLSCKLCKRFVQMVDDAIAQDVAQVQQVREILGDLCDSMAADSMCHTFIKQFDDVVSWLKHGTSPAVVCARLTMCTATAASIEEEKKIAAMAVVAPATTATTAMAPICDVTHGCFYCVQISTVVGFVAQHAPDQLDSVRTILKYICKLTPESCKCSETEKNYDKIVALTKQGKTPKEVCMAIGLCTKTHMTDPRTAKMLALVESPLLTVKLSSLLMTASPMDDKKCLYCDYFTTLIQVALQEDPTDLQEIRQYADIVCGILGDKNVCHQYVDKLGFVMDALNNGKKPRAICEDLKFCMAKTMIGSKSYSNTQRLPSGVDTSALLKHTMTKSVVVPRPVSGLDNCFFCTQVATLFEVAIAQDPSKIDQIRTVADLVCKALPKENKCHEVMKEIDTIIDSIKKGEKPVAICHDLKFCPAHAVGSQSALVVVATSPLDDKKCFYCDYIITLIQVVHQERQTDVEVIRQYADIVCGMLGDTNICHQYVNKLGYVIDALNKGKKPRAICADLKFCTAKVTAVATQMNAVALRGLDNCFFCTQAASLFEVMIAQDPSQVSTIRMVADLVCQAMPIDNKCHQVMKEIDTIIDSIKRGKKPVAICRDLKFCPAARAMEPETETALVVATSVSPADDKKCFYCDYFTTLIQVALQEDPTDLQEIRQYADIVCGVLGDTNVCHQYVDKLGFVIDALNKGKKPRAICADLKFCAAKMKTLSDSKTSKTTSMMKVVSSAVGGLDNCFFCTQAASLFEVAIAQDPSKIDHIRMVADLVCKALPKENQCHQVMKEIDTVIDSIKRGEKPAAICHDLKFCPAHTLSAVLPTSVMSVRNNNCAYCDGMATVLEYAIKLKPDQVQQLREAAGLVCDFMPEKDLCHDDLKMLDKAVLALKAGKSPHEICTELKFCDSTATSKLTPLSIAKLEMLNAKANAVENTTVDKSMSVGCLLCEYTAELLVHIRGDTSELHMTKQALQTMCFVLPPRARCDVLSSKFDKLVELVSQGKSPSQACHALSLCDAAFVQPPPAMTATRFGSVVATQ